MTDEIRNQIDADASRYASKFDSEYRDRAQEDYDAGASNQDPIAHARGRNAGIQEAIDYLKREPWRFETDADIVEVFKELERLKR